MQKKKKKKTRCSEQDTRQELQRGLEGQRQSPMGSIRASPVATLVKARRSTGSFVPSLIHIGASVVSAGTSALSRGKDTVLLLRNVPVHSRGPKDCGMGLPKRHRWMSFILRASLYPLPPDVWEPLRDLSPGRWRWSVPAPCGRLRVLSTVPSGTRSS
jgi:hypothetical protein